MKRTILLLLTLSLILGAFSSCGHKTVDPIDDQTSSSPSEDTSAESTENVIDDSTELNEVNQSENTETDDRLTEITTAYDYLDDYTYRVEKIDGKYYMIWNDYYHSLITDEPAMYPIKYSSFEALKNDLLARTLDPGHVKRILKYRVRKDNYTRLPITDLDHFVKPILPDGWECLSEFEWYVDYYKFTAIIGDYKAYISILTEEQYNNTLNNVSPFGSEGIDSVLNEYKEDLLPQRKVQQGSKTVYLLRRDLNERLDACIFFTNGDYWGFIQGNYPFQDLTDEQLLSFGFEEYLG